MKQRYSFRAFLFLSLGLLAGPLLQAATIVVTNTGDSGMGSLRQAVMMASSGDTITFSSFTDGDFIRLDTSIYITKDLMIQGNGTSQTRLNGNNISRAFEVRQNAMVKINDLSIVNGRAQIGGALRVRSGSTLEINNVVVDNSAATGRRPGQGGGAIHNAGVLRVMNSVLTNNTALGLNNGSGGAILNAPGGTLMVMDSRIEKNEANRAGGGIEDASGAGSEVTITNTRINRNVVFDMPGNGGGIHIGSDGDVTISGGTIDLNEAGAEGGGVWNGAGTLRVSNTLIRENVAMGDAADQGGGGLYNNGMGTIILSDNVRVLNNKATGTSGSGGGILNNTDATLTISDSRIKGNKANRAGGGIEDASGGGSAFTITNSMIDKNRLGTMPGNGGGIHIGGDGNLTISGGTVNDNKATEGGGIWNGSGTLTVMDQTRIRRNVATGNDADQGGGGLYNNGGGTIAISGGVQILNNKATGTSGSGGGILNNTGATLTISDSRIEGNEANRAGGGIEDASGSGSAFTITDSKINDNAVFDAPGNGGGIHIGGDGSLSVTGGMINGNTAGAEGGGIWNNLGTLSITGTTIKNNVAMGDDANQGGGGLYNNGGGVIDLDNVTLVENKATGTAGSGGGILNNTGASLIVINSRIDKNEANRAGGGIEDASGSGSEVTITDTRINRNVVFNMPGNGGGIHVGSDGDVTVIDATIDLNTAGAEGGGLWNGAGTMRVSGSLVRQNKATGDNADQGGGGLYNNGGTLIVENTGIKENMATGTSGSGGGLFSSGGSVTVTGGKVANNTANRAGGGVEIVEGSYTSNDVEYIGNDAGANPGNGGAFHVTGMMSTVDFTGDKVKDNVAANEGGGLWNQSGTMMSLTQVSVLNNRVTGEGGTENVVGGGGIFNNGGVLDIDMSTVADNELTGGGLNAGGGITNDTRGSLTVMRSTISGNDGGLAGGGIANDGEVELLNSTVTNNFAVGGGGYAQASNNATATVTGTIIADNLALIAPDFASVISMVTSGGFNLIGKDPNDQFPDTDTDKEGMSAQLLPLADNGGTTMTHEPLCSSPAIDMGDPDDSSPDQIGQPVFSARRDIGSFEKQEFCGPDARVADRRPSEPRADVLDGLDQLSVYPNPVVQDYLVVSIPSQFTHDATLRIIGSDGRVYSLGVTQASQRRLDLSSYAVGSYVLQVVEGDDVRTKRFVIMR